MAIVKDQVEVYHPDKDGTRMMGKDQFEFWGKAIGWKEVPETKKGKTETTDDSAGKGDETSNDENTGSSDRHQILDLSAKDAIAHIKQLGEANDVDAIQSAKEAEETRNDDKEPRSTVISAADKFLNVK